MLELLKTKEFVQRLGGTPLDQATKDPEMMMLMERCNVFLSDLKTTKKIHEAMQELVEATGRESGTLTMSFENFNDPFSLAIFEAAFANNREMFESVFLNRIKGAIIEFSFDPTLEKTLDGTTIEGTQTAQPAAMVRD